MSEAASSNEVASSAATLARGGGGAGPDGTRPTEAFLGAALAAVQQAPLQNGSMLALRRVPGAGLAIVAPLGYGVSLAGLEAAMGQAQFLRAFSAGSTLVTYDQRGAGDSLGAGLPQGWRELAEDLWRVADAAGVERVVLYGVADAGYTVLHAAARQPERVLAMILNFVPPAFGVSSWESGVPAEYVHRWFSDADGGRPGVLAMMEEYGIAGGDAEAVAAAWPDTGPAYRAHAVDLLSNASLDSLLPALDQPTLVMAPKRRPIFANWGWRLSAQLRHAQVVEPARSIEALGAVQAFVSLLGVSVGRGASHLTPALFQTLERGEQAMKELKRIAVAVDDDVTSARAVELACRLGEAQRSEIALIHVVKVPYALSLDAPPPEAVKRGERALELGDAIVQRHGLPPARRRLVPGRSIAGSILLAAEALGSDLIVVANRGAPDQTTASSEVVEELVRRAPGKIIVDRAIL